MKRRHAMCFQRLTMNVVVTIQILPLRRHFEKRSYPLLCPLRIQAEGKSYSPLTLIFCVFVTPTMLTLVVPFLIMQTEAVDGHPEKRTKGNFSKAGKSLRRTPSALQTS